MKDMTKLLSLVKTAIDIQIIFVDLITDMI
jgi:hypothetical protein